MTPAHRFDLALHIGAGADAEVSLELARRFVLVEPDPEAAAALRARMADSAAVDIVEAAVAGDGASGTLHVFNLPGYASLRRATGLRRLFPGLATVRAATVKKLAPAALLSGLDLSGDARVLLIVDAPGEEMDILKGLLEAHHPAVFAEIRFRCGEIALYEGSEDAEAVCALLRRAGFEVGVPALEDDPDRPMRVARLDQTGAVVAMLKAELAKARETLAARDKALAEREEALKAAEAGRAAAAAELAKAREALAARDKTLAEREEALKAAQARQSAGDADIAKARETLAARDKALAEREDALRAAQARQSAGDADLAKARDTLAERDKALAEREEALKAAEAGRATAAAELAEAREALAARDKALAEREDALRAAQARQSAGDADLAKARDTLAEREEALETAKSDLSLGLRLQSLREGDLKALQERYGKLLDENEKQATLLQKLTERLSAAAYYLEKVEASEHCLEDADPETSRPALGKVT